MSMQPAMSAQINLKLIHTFPLVAEPLRQSARGHRHRF